MITGHHFLRKEELRVQCTLCAHYCTLDNGQTGACHVRKNVAGDLIAESFNRPVMVSVEPVEKKFLFHVMPGASTLSVSTAGCNFRCQYCINWRVSQRGVHETDAIYSAEEIVVRAYSEGVDAIAFTYTEPTIFFEYMLAIAEAAQDYHLPIFLKSNGYMTPEVLRTIASFTCAMNIDLKAWQPRNHQQVTGAALQPVLDNLCLAKSLGIWVEVSTLIVPTLNDCVEDWKGIACFIRDYLGSDTPWHLHRFFPNFQMQHLPATSQSHLEQAIEVGYEVGLQYIYSKDLTRSHTQTRCPQCKTVLIDRRGFHLLKNEVVSGQCPVCNLSIPGFKVTRDSIA